MVRATRKIRTLFRKLIACAQAQSVGGKTLDESILTRAEVHEGIWSAPMVGTCLIHMANRGRSRTDVSVLEPKDIRCSKETTIKVTQIRLAWGDTFSRGFYYGSNSDCV